MGKITGTRAGTGDPDAMTVLDETLRRRHELRITGPLSMSSDEIDSEVKFLNRVLRIVHYENCRRRPKTVDTSEDDEGMDSCAGVCELASLFDVSR